MSTENIKVYNDMPTELQMNFANSYLSQAKIVHNKVTPVRKKNPSRASDEDILMRSRVSSVQEGGAGAEIHHMQNSSKKALSP